MFLLDTNICSAHMRRPGGLAHRFMQHSSQLVMSTIVLAELYAGARIAADPRPLLQGIRDLLLDVRLMPFGSAAASVFGELRGTLKRRGLAVNPIDLMIAAVALAHDLTLVTHDTKDFESIPRLRLVDWLAD